MDISKNKEIGRRIKAIREDMEISQTRLGNVIGVSYQQIQKYENGTSTLSVEKLDKIAAALTTPISYFFGDYAKKNYKVGKIREEVYNECFRI
jgi:transcriptional regulator with XRE-family HTH domain